MLYKLSVFCVTISLCGMFRFNCGLHLTQKRRKVTQLYIVASSFDSTTLGVPKHHHNFRAGHLTGKFHAAKNVLIQYVACYAAAKHVAKSLVKN